MVEELEFVSIKKVGEILKRIDMALLENGLSQKCRTIYTVDEKGKKIKNGEIPIINDGTYEDYQGFLKILEMYLVSLGINQARQVLLIADGAEWIWKHIPPLLEKLNCPTETYQSHRLLSRYRTHTSICR